MNVKVFWYDSVRQVGIDCASPEPMSKDEACLVWSDQVPGEPGSFLGLVDADDRTLQLYVAESIPDNIDDAGPLACVDLDIPAPELSGSYSARIRFMDVYSIIAKVYEKGVDLRDYNLAFTKW